MPVTYRIPAQPCSSDLTLPTHLSAPSLQWEKRQSFEFTDGIWYVFSQILGKVKAPGRFLSGTGLIVRTGSGKP